MEKINKIMKSIATLGNIGYLPAPGTMGTLAALPIAFVLHFLCVPYQIGSIIIASCMSYLIIKKALPFFASSDPSQIILDEVMGCCVTLCGIQFSWQAWIAGFIIFRIFDIFKPFGIKQVEKLPGAWGILLDDVVAGLCAHMIVRYFF